MPRPVHGAFPQATLSEPAKSSAEINKSSMSGNRVDPTATVVGLSENLLRFKRCAHVAADHCFLCTVDRPVFDDLWRNGEFFEQRYLCDSLAQIMSATGRIKDRIVSAYAGRDEIRKVRNTWPLFCDRRPESYSLFIAL